MILLLLGSSLTGQIVRGATAVVAVPARPHAVVVVPPRPTAVAS